MDIVKTKLVVPTLPSALVERAALLKKSEARPKAKLILVSAPAGAGKATLLSQRVRQYGQRVAWVSFEIGENNLESFLLRLMGALEQVRILSGNAPPTGLCSPGVTISKYLALDMPPEQATPLTFMLGGHQTMTNPAAHEVTEFFLEHLLSPVRLALRTRIDSPFIIGRLRMRGKLRETRNSALRFGGPKATDLSNAHCRLDLPKRPLRSSSIAPRSRPQACHLLPRRDPRFDYLGFLYGRPERNPYNPPKNGP